MDIEGEEGNTGVGNAAERSLDAVADGCLGSNSKQKEIQTKIRMPQHNKPKKAHIAQVVSRDYICTKEDIEIIEYMKSAPEKQILVDIDSAFVDRYHMECLFHGDMQLNGDVISAYINCIMGEKHLLHRVGGKVFLEDTFISSILKRDGGLKLDQINYKEDTFEIRVDNYLDHDMVFIPINIENFHWYLAVLNAPKCEVHVLDSMGKIDRTDLTITLRGLDKHIKVTAKHKELKQHKLWNVDVTTWPVIEKILKPMQKDGTSCGLWMINYMEYWTGSQLSDSFTQDDITNFRFNLPAILWASKLNTKKGCQEPEKTNEEESQHDVEFIDAPGEEPKPSNTSHQTKSDTSLCVLSTGITPASSPHELMGALCKYIISIDHAESLEKEWVRSTKPYPISITLRKLQETLHVNKPMDSASFNMVVRMLACNDLLLFQDEKLHYMDLQFCSLSDFDREPCRRSKLDVQQLAKLFKCWPNMEYDISHCNKILLPYSFLGHFILFILHMKDRSVSILDPQSIPTWFKAQHPTMYYIHKIHKIANNVKLAMEEANPTWNDDIYVWRRILPTCVPKTKDWDITGYFVINFMRSWMGSC